MEVMNLKEADRKKLMEYLAGREQVSVQELMEQCGADKLRVYPLLFELAQEGLVKMVKESALGAPEIVELTR